MDQLPLILIKLTYWGYCAGALVGLLLWRKDKLAGLFSFGCSTFGSLFGIVACLRIMLAGQGAAVQTVQLLPSSVPYLSFTLCLDPLGLFFTLIVSVLGLALSVYSVGYAEGFHGRKNIGLMGFLFNAALLATTTVFLADNAFFFLLAWELMALSIFSLVCTEHEKAEARDAGVLFFVMSHIGTGCLILGFLLLFKASGGYAFAGFHDIGHTMAAGPRNAAFILFLAGFGLKAGIIPLHIWLPVAHPAAPSNVSALMSGVVIKTGIYGLTRVLFDFLGPPPQWWGVTVLAIGTISAVLGVLYALMEHDLKRLLAYHSIENIGIILMGLGASLMFVNSGHPLLAAFALVAGLYHTINHAIFKALLFLGAGSVLHATHSRNMEEMGGLAKRMPYTAFFFLIGAVAISALPPLNGFVSEWLTYQSLLQGYDTTPSLIRLMFPLSGAMLALTGALAAACFVKAYGITFLAQPRSEHASQAHEVSFTMLFGQALLALVCVVLGLFPVHFINLLDPLTLQLTGQALSSHIGTAQDFVLSGVNASGGSVSTLGLAMMGLCLLPVPLGLWLVFGRGSKVRRGPTWDCGLQGLTPRMEYTATGFSKPIRMIFSALFRPRREVQREYDFSPFFAKTLRFESHVEEVFLTRIYRPLYGLLWYASRRMRGLQAGSLQAYLSYIFVTLLLLLIFAL